MKFNLSTVANWFGWARGAITERAGQQNGRPVAKLVDGDPVLGVDSALQISTVWSCIDRRATTIASLPFFAYQTILGQKALARTSRLYALLHDSPNSRMTPFEFWRALVMNHDLRGNGYARIARAPDGEALALWPMPSDQTEAFVLKDGSMVYLYRVENDVVVLAEENVLHLKGLGNGTTGLAKLEFMGATVNEAAQAQRAASSLFRNGGKPSGVLMVDELLQPEQRDQIRVEFAEMEMGLSHSLHVLEAGMKYQQLNLTPAQQQLLETRRHSVEEICRWFDVPPVLAHHSNVTTWGSGIDSIMDGWYKLSVRPMLVSIEQAVRKRVMTAKQRASMTAEFSLDALLRGNAKDRAEIAAKKVQNGLATRNEMRQLENEPPLPGGDILTVQSNLVPIHTVGKIKPTGGGDAATKDPEAQ